MKIEILEFIKGAREARGIAVIIDVFRAFSTACYAYDSGASGVIATSEPEEAFKLRMSYNNSVLAGERNERKIDGFDLGNSPTEIIKTDLSGKTVIQTTTAGTAGLLSAVNADIVLTGSLVNAGSIVNYITSIKPELVSLVAMGYRATISADEDLLCAKYIEAGLRGQKFPNLKEEISKLREGAGKRFFDPANLEFSPPTDFFLCTIPDRFGFILKSERRNDGNAVLLRIDM